MMSVVIIWMIIPVGSTQAFLVEIDRTWIETQIIQVNYIGASRWMYYLINQLIN